MMQKHMSYGGSGVQEYMRYMSTRYRGSGVYDHCKYNRIIGVKHITSQVSQYE